MNSKGKFLFKMESLLNELRKHHIDIGVVEGRLKLYLPQGFDNDELIGKIKANKEGIISFIESKKKKAYKNIAIAGDKSQYALSSAQKRLFFLNRFDKNQLEYNMPSAIKIIGKVEVAKIESTFSKLIERHEILRTSFHLNDGEPVQKIHSEVPFKVEVLFAKEQEISGIVKNFIKPFNLAKAPLFKAQIVQLSDNESILLTDMHHIVSDGVSQGIFINEFRQLYSGEELMPLKIQYKDYAEWQQASLTDKEYLQSRDFWLGEFKEEYENLELPVDFKEKSNANREGSHEYFVLEAEVCKRLAQLAARHQTTLFNVLLAIYSVLLSKLGSQEETSVGVPVAGRQHADLDGVLGVFINTLVLKNSVDQNLSFGEFLDNVKAKTLNAFEHQNFPYEELVSHMKLDRSKRKFLFDAFFSFENFEEAVFDVAGLKFESYPLPESNAKFDLQLTVSKREEQLGILFSYAKAVFRKETIKRFADYFKKIAGSVANDENIIIRNINLLLYHDSRILSRYNETARNYDTDRSILMRFREQVASNPNKTAIKFEKSELSYKELDRKSNRVANFLISQNIGKNSLVPIVMERSLELSIAILGILKSGAAYVPVDPEYPQERIDYILKEVSPSVILTSSKFVNRLQPLSKDTEICNLDIETLDKALSRFEETDPQVKIDENSMAYVIYTSGTSGRPKGVINNHAGILNRLIWMCEYLNVTPNDNILQKTTYCFDVSVWELLLPLISGARLVFCKPEGHKDIPYLKQLIENESVSIMHFVPSMLSVFLSDLKSFDAKSLKHIVCSGEELKRSHITAFKNVFDQATKLHNFYGPTEAAIDVTATEITDFSNENKVISIGSPVANTNVYILDKYGKLQPPGIKGELVIGGIQVARGYLNREELTAEKFRLKTISKNKKERVYHTGDFARWLPDGNLEYLGRIDMQVKIRGNRIELGEIESCIEEINGINQAVVTVQGEGDQQVLIAYYTGIDAIESKSIIKHLQDKLPAYMVPAFCKYLDEIPVTASGKVNKKALPEISISKALEYVAPQTEVQEKLIEIWAEILKAEPENISITSGFFELGGNSLSTLRMVQQADVKLGISIPVHWVFEAPTVEKLSAKIQERYSWTAGFDKNFKNLEQSKEVKIAEIEKSENNKPLFFCSPLGGIMPSTSIIGILDMAPYLKEKASFYGVQAPALFPGMLDLINEDKEVNLKNWDFSIAAFEKIVAQTAEALIHINGFNTYQLGGFCSGCVLAVEVTKYLKMMGRQVDELILIDPPLWMIQPNNCNDINAEYTREDIAPFIADDLGWNTDLNKESFMKHLSFFPLNEAWRLSREALISKNAIDEKVKEEDIKRAFSHKFFNDKALSLFFAKNSFSISRISETTSVLLLMQEGEFPEGAETHQFINNYIAGNFKLDTFSGNHNTLFQKENLQKWVAKVSQHLFYKKAYPVTG